MSEENKQPLEQEEVVETPEAQVEQDAAQDAEKAEKKAKKKKEKIIYYDDNSTIVDMSSVNRKGEPKKPQPARRQSTARQKWETYWGAVKRMFVPMLVVMVAICVIYMIIWLIFFLMY